MDYLEPEAIETILASDGSIDSDRAPKLDTDRLLEMYRGMLLARRFDDRLLNLQRQGKLGTFAPVRGQEAAQVGSAAALRADDWMVPAFRENAAALWRGTPLDGLFLFVAGFNEGQAIPEGQNDLPTAVPVATQLPHAVGIGYGLKFQESDSVVLTYFGDGATSEGDFHEALNFAGVFGAPVVFLCQNNHWAISVPREKQTRSETLAQKAVAYGIQGVQVDGNDLLSVYKATSDAVRRAREEGLPTLIECVTYRLHVHTTVDDPSLYRSEKEVERWRRYDPLDRVREHLKARRKLSDKQHDKLEKELKDEIESGWKKARDAIKKLDDPSVIFDHIFAEPTPLIEAQRAEFERLQGAGKASDG